jgi:hypothetical protein
MVMSALAGGRGVDEGDCPTAKELVGVLLLERVPEKEKVVEEEGVTGAVPMAVRVLKAEAVLASLARGREVRVAVPVATCRAVAVAPAAAPPGVGVPAAVGATLTVLSVL